MYKKMKQLPCRKKVKATKCDRTEKHKTPHTPQFNFSIRSVSSFDVHQRCTCGDDDSEPDRSNPLWKIQPPDETEEEPEEETTSFIQPQHSLWEEIMIEYEDKRLEYFNFLENLKPFEPALPVLSKLSAVQYLDQHIFPLLCPILEETLFKAKEWDCLSVQKCRFNGLDYIAELLWNRNPRHRSRAGKHRNIFDIPFVIIWLYLNPRPIYPLSWLWTKEEAVTVLQTYIRRYNVCKEQECSEMRQFWKTMRVELEEKIREKHEKLIEELNVLFNDILDKLVADAVFEAEWKIYGCRCVKKPCQCVCKCMRWCKCCTCYKIPIHEAAPCNCKKTDEEKK